MFDIADRINNTTRSKWQIWLICLFFIMSLMSVLTFGISIFAHINYNLDSLIRIQTGVSGAKGLSEFSGSSMNLMYYFNTLIVPFLQFGVIALFMAIVVKFIAFYLIYAISYELIKARFQSLIISLLFLITPSSAIHGVATVGIWSEPALFNASLTVICTLTGLLMYLKNHIVLAGIIFAISLHFHQLYGITPLAWLFPGVLISLFNKQKRDIALFFVGFLLVLLSLFYLYSFSYSGYDSVETDISEWYRYIYSIEPDDVSLIWTLEMFGFGLLPIIIGGAYIAIQTKNKKEAEFLMVGVAISFVFIMALELLHRYGIFFGKLSEYFLIVELRRGIWIATLISLIVIIKNTANLSGQSSKLGKVFLISSGIATFLAPSYLTASLFFACYLYFSRTLISIIIFIVIIATVIYSCINGMLSLPQAPSIILFVISTVAALALFKLKQTASSTTAMAIILMVMFAYTAAGVMEGRFSKSFDSLTSNGIFSRTDYNYLYKSYKSWAGGTLDEKSNKEILLQEFFEGDKIQLPPTQLSYQDVSYYGYPLVFSRQNVAAPCFSIAELQITKDNIRSLIGDNLTNAFFAQGKFYSKKLMLEYLENAYNSLTITQLINARVKTGLRFYFIKTERDELKETLLCSGDLYFVYDLSKLKNQD